MNNYLSLIVGFSIGLAALSSVRAWKIQKDNKAINFRESLIIVFIKSPWPTILSLVALFGALYILPETLKNLLNAESAGAEMPYYQLFIVKWFRISSIAFGATSQLITTLFVGQSEKFVTALLGQKEKENQS